MSGTPGAIQIGQHLGTGLYLCQGCYFPPSRCVCPWFHFVLLRPPAGFAFYPLLEPRINHYRPNPFLPTTVEAAS